MISIGVIGCGDIGRILIRTLSTIPTCQLKAICDQNEKKLKADPSGAPLAYRALDYNTLLGDRELRAIAIATPTHTCFPIAKNALLAGKHVLVFSLTAFSKAEFEEILSISRRSRLIVLGAQAEITSGVPNGIAEAIKHQPIGELRSIAIRRLTIREPERTGINPLEIDATDISIILGLLQETPKRTHCHVDFTPNPSYRKSIRISLHFSRGRTAIINATSNAPCDSYEIRIAGSSTSISLLNDCGSERSHRLAADTRKTKDFNRPHYRQPPEDELLGELLPTRFEQEPLRKSCLRFIYCILNKNDLYAEHINLMKVITLLDSLPTRFTNNSYK